MDQGRSRPVLTVAVCCAMQAIGGGLGWSLLPPLMGSIAKDLAISPAMGGVVWGAAPLGIALASPFGGAAADKLGPRRVAAFATLVGALACAARAFAFDAWSLAVTMLVFGAHIGFVAPAVPKALAQHVPLTKLARANGVALLGYTLGTAATVLTAQTVLAPALGGWKNAMIAAAGAMVLVAALWASLIRDRGAVSVHARYTDSLRLARNPQLLRVAAMHFLLFGGYLALLGFLPHALAESGLSPARVGVAVASWLTVAGAANFAGPWISDRIGRRRVIFLVGAVVAGGALAGFAVAPSLGWLVVAALGGGCIAPLLLAAPVEIPGVGAAKAGAALGLLMLIGQAGGFLLPMLMGAIAQGASFGAALGALAVVHLAILIPAYGLKETGHAGAQQVPEAA